VNIRKRSGERGLVEQGYKRIKKKCNKRGEGERPYEKREKRRRAFNFQRQENAAKTRAEREPSSVEEPAVPILRVELTNQVASNSEDGKKGEKGRHLIYRKKKGGGWKKKKKKKGAPHPLRGKRGKVTGGDEVGRGGKKEITWRGRKEECGVWNYQKKKQTPRTPEGGKNKLKGL